MDSRDEEPLSEKDFIHEGYSKDPYPLWLWLFILTVVIALIWGGSAYYRKEMGEKISEEPFLQVTNRELSVFLWQDPALMRVNTSPKTGYLPAFQYLDQVTPEPDLADNYAEAPPELLYRYHTWDRLLKEEFIKRPINPSEFKEFLNLDLEWDPKNWSKATPEYVNLVKNLKSYADVDLQTLNEQQLPLLVRLAFQGWKNYYKEGNEINALEPTYEDAAELIEAHPHYARNYWRNFDLNYLKSKKGKVIPKEELPSFLRVALYNFLRAKKEYGVKLQLIPTSP